MRNFDKTLFLLGALALVGFTIQKTSNVNMLFWMIPVAFVALLLFQNNNQNPPATT
jgi:hypothetical protein